jgi:glycine C-acetyltransferase
MSDLKNKIENQLSAMHESGTYKNERIIGSSQETSIFVNNNDVLNFCANNYLGLANDIRIKNAAIQAINEWGYGLASVRFICGTQEIHKLLEKRVSNFLKKEDAILYSSCFDANGGIFETILDENDAIFSDELNHASIIDGIRLCRAQKNRYKHVDMEDLESLLKKSTSKTKLIVTDGVFSMDGNIAPLKEITELSKRYDALVMVDDCHATGVIGANGMGSGSYHGVHDSIDIISSTFGKALGGASGGFIASSNKIIELLRQKSRPYLFSNSMAPPLVSASIEALNIINSDSFIFERLNENTSYFRQRIIDTGFEIRGDDHPIVPIMIYDAKKAMELSKKLLEKNIYVIAFSFPVVPKEKARIRVQLSSAHTKNQIDLAIDSFKECAQELNII